MSHPKHAAPRKPAAIAPGPEVAAPRRPPRFPAFDGLRAIAAITVVVVHVSFVSGLTPRNPHAVGMYTARLEIGVSVFFLISGFLLYRPFVVAHLARAPRPRTGAFWLRRLLRIVPA
jgi:peptidoglycan/LPS O-acetylase OafA/YrhL